MFIRMGIIDEILEQEDNLRVEKGDRAYSDQRTVYADDLGSCIGVAAYDPKTRRGYLMHSATYQNGELEDELDRMVKDLEDFEEPFEVLAGGTVKPGTNPLQESSEMAYSRALVQKKLSEAGLSYIVDWNQAPVFNRLLVDPDYGILYDIAK